jgi:hypothetical protein
MICPEREVPVEEGGSHDPDRYPGAAGPEVAALSDDTRKEIVALREGGMTLAELKTRFPQLTSEQLREVLPAGNARERKAREAKAPKSESKVEAAPKPEPAPRWVTGKDAEALAERVLDARKIVGRNRLAELLSVTGSAVWRFENARIRPDELDGLISGMSQVDQRIEQGDFVKAATEPKAKTATKAELEHRLTTVMELVRQARDTTKVSEKNAALDLALTVDAPQA